jgi:hypothetical protein
MVVNLSISWQHLLNRSSFNLEIFQKEGLTKGESLSENCSDNPGWVDSFRRKSLGQRGMLDSFRRKSLGQSGMLDGFRRKSLGQSGMLDGFRRKSLGQSGMLDGSGGSG